MERRGWRRILPLLVLASALVGLFWTLPQETTIHWRLEQKNEGLSRLEIDLWDTADEPQLVRHTDYYYSPSRPAPVVQTQTVKLQKGQYRARAVLYYQERTEQLTRELEFTQQELVEILLSTPRQ